METEEALIERIARGDEAALDDLHARLAGHVRALALRMLTVREEAEEVVQDTFVALHRNAGRFDVERGSARAFTYTIARNLCRSRLRARGARPRSLPDRDVHDPRDDLSASPRDHVTHLLVHGALDHLPPSDRSLVEDAFFQGYSHREIAERLDLPLGTVKTRMRRALLKLRALLES